MNTFFCYCVIPFLFVFIKLLDILYAISNQYVVTVCVIGRWVGGGVGGGEGGGGGGGTGGGRGGVGGLGERAGEGGKTGGRALRQGYVYDNVFSISSTRGIVLDTDLGNFLKLAEDGTILR